MLSDTQSSQYGIIALLPPEAAAYAQALHTDLDERFGLNARGDVPWLPHVTLKYHFSTNDIALVEEVLAQFARTEQPVSWEIDGFDSFEDGDVRVIFMDVRPNSAVRAFHDRLLTRLRAFDWMTWGVHDGPNMHFHATIAHRGLTPKNFDEVWQFVTSQEMPRFELLLDNVSLVEVNGRSERATLLRRFDLAGAAA